MGKTKGKRMDTKDILVLVYTQRHSSLFGQIAFFKHRAGSHTKPFHQSAPFVISDSIGPNETIVYGSLNHLVHEVQRLLKDMNDHVRGLDAALGCTVQKPGVPGKRAVLKQVPDGEAERRTYSEYSRRIANTLILISSQTRNLFQILPRLNKHSVSLFDRNGKATGSIRLTDLFDQFVHNRYLFLDGEYVWDLFSDKPPRRAPISQTFMGYRINWIEYVDEIESAIRGIKLKDLTGLLRGRLKGLSLKSPHKDIVFLVQNLESFSGLFATKVPDARFSSMLDLLVPEVTKAYLHENVPNLKEGEEMHVASFWGARAHVKIHEELHKKDFKLQVRCRCVLRDSEGRLVHEEPESIWRTIEIGYEQFLAHVNSVFGDDPLLDSGRGGRGGWRAGPELDAPRPVSQEY